MANYRINSGVWRDFAARTKLLMQKNNVKEFPAIEITLTTFQKAGYLKEIPPYILVNKIHNFLSGKSKDPYNQIKEIITEKGEGFVEIKT